MGNKQTKKKSSVKAQAKPAVTRGKSLDNVKRVLLLYKASTESSEAQDIVDHFCDALNQVKPPGCVAIENENVLNVFKYDDESVKNRTEKWLAAPNNVLIIFCLGGKEDLSRQHFTDNSGALFTKIFPVCLGTEGPAEWPTEWPEAYSLGVANPEKINRPNDFEGGGLDTLVAAIRGVE